MMRRTVLKGLQRTPAREFAPPGRARSHSEAPVDDSEAPVQSEPGDVEESREEWNIETMSPENCEYPGTYDQTEHYDPSRLFALKPGIDLNRAGDNIALDPANYDIDIVEADGECYIPFNGVTLYHKPFLSN